MSKYADFNQKILPIEVRMKGQSSEEKARILAIAGNPKNGLVEKLNSVENGFRILQRFYFYDKIKKRSGNIKKAIGVVIDDNYLSLDEYHVKYTHRGNFRVIHNSNKYNNDSSIENSRDIIDYKCIYQRIIGAIPILYNTAKNCGIVEDVYTVYGRNLGNKILSLAFYLIQEGDNSTNRFSRFSLIYALPYAETITESEVAKIYAHIGQNKKLLSKLFSLRYNRLSDDCSVNYASTNIPSKENNIYFSKISKTNEEIYASMFHFSLLTEQKTGMPFLFTLFNSNDPDYSNVSDIINRVQELVGKDKKNIFIIDRSYETFENLIIFSKEHKKCLMAARVLNQDIVNKVKNNCTDFSNSSSIISGTCIHGHSEKISIRYREENYPLWVHIFKDDCKAAREKEILFEKLEIFEKKWKNSNKSGRTVLKSNSLIRFYKDIEDSDNLIRSYVEIDDYMKDFGIFANISNFEMTSKEAYEKYASRDTVEEYFQSVRININLDTVRSHFQETLQGRFIIGFISLIILAELKLQLSQERIFSDKRKKAISPHAYSVTDVIDITRGITLQYAQKTNQYWIGGVLKEVVRLCAACGLDNDLYEKKPEYIESLSYFAIKQ